MTPEEAELLIPLVRGARKPKAHLLTYTASVTRKMVHFNDLTFYSIPSMAPGWNAPDWMKTELGLLAGRLYFDFDEFASLSKYLGLGHDEPDGDFEPLTGNLALTDGDATEEGEMQEQQHDDEDKKKKKKKKKGAVGFTAKPLTFLQEWLAVRRKGQDFTHTPMGYICQGKPLNASHPFFGKVSEEPALQANGGNMRGGSGGVANGVGSSSMGANSVPNGFHDDEDDYDGADEGDMWFDAPEDLSGLEEDGEEVEEVVR